MAEEEDLVALILSALGSASAGELCILSELLASESSLQLQRLWLLVGSPSRCLAIISFLDSLSHHHRRLLLARVTLRLVCRITDFLEDPASSQQAFDSSMANPVHTDWARHRSLAASPHCSESPYSHLNKEDVPARLKHANAMFHSLADGGTHQQKEEEGTNVNSTHANMIHRESSSSCLQTMPHLKNQRLLGACAGQPFDKAGKFTSMHFAGGESFEKPGVDITNGRLTDVDFEGSSHRPTFVEPVDNTLACTHVTNLDMRNAFKKSCNTRIVNLDTVSPLIACMCSWVSSPNAICSCPDLSLNMASTSCDNEMDNLYLPWGETDAAFLFLFLWETQEQECQEAVQRWCVDPFVCHLLIVQDMAVLVDNEKKAGRIRAPRWREHLQQYLQENILQIGYGFPGIMASANLPASLSTYIDTIGRFQRILESMNVEEGSEQTMPAASEEALHSLPTTVIGLSSEDKGKLCIICKEELEPLSVASQLPCMHVYHWDCILSWLKQRNNCPVCRHELPSDDYDHELRRKIQILRERVV